MKIAWICIFCAVLIWSAISPEDYFVWFLEVLPALMGFIVLWLTYKKFKLTGLTYLLILIHCIILMVGAHYTYAHEPLFNWIKESLDLSRNNYDKVGHFAQGFIPAIIAREILIRKTVINSRAWLNFLIGCICLAISAFYEIIEWWVGVLSGESAEKFLGTQGYMWDTQSDMALALIGSILALFFLSGIHDKQLQDIEK